MNKSCEMDGISRFIGLTARVLPEPVEQFSTVLEQLGTDAEVLVNAGEILFRSHYLACAERCYSRALISSPEHHQAAWNHVRVLIDLRRTRDAMAGLSVLVNRHGFATCELVDYVCNQALWIGQHQLVAEFIAGNVVLFAHAAKRDPDGYLADALLSYACEADPNLFKALAELYEINVGKPHPRLGQFFLSNISQGNDFLFASHGFAGTSAMVSFLLLIGVRVDEISRCWDKGYSLNSETELRTYCSPPTDELPARLIRKFFPLQRYVRCYSFSHRLPNPEFCADRPCLFLIRDPRDSLTTWVKPTVRQVQSGVFARFVAIQAQDWCDFIDGIEKISPRLIVRFEDWKADPIGTARNIIHLFQLNVRQSELEEALFFSGTEMSRQLRAAQREIFGMLPTYPVSPHDPLATREMFTTEYALIEKICGDRLVKYGYDFHQ